MRQHLLACLAVLALAAGVRAEDAPVTPAHESDGDDHTPAAGEHYTGEVFGNTFEAPARDRSLIMALLARRRPPYDEGQRRRRSLPLQWRPPEVQP